MNDTPLDHADHDPLLIAAHAADDLPAADRPRANALLDGCAECSALRADLLLLSSAVRDAPTPPRPRDFRLSPDDLARARRTGWRRALAAFAAPRFDVFRPVGATLATLGVAGLLLTAVPSFSLMGAAGADPGASFGPAANPYSAAGAPSGGDGQPAASPGAAGRPAASPGDAVGTPEGDLGVGQGIGEPGASPLPIEAAPDSAEQPTRQVVGDSAAVDPRADARRAGEDVTLPVVSGTFLIAGIGLLGLRWTARRLGDG